MNWISFLVTGPEANLMAWQQAAMFEVELFERRGQTVLCRAHGIDFLDLGNPGWGKEQPAEAVNQRLDRAIELARTHDVTIQRLDRTDAGEQAILLHLGSHEMKWPTPRSEP